MKLYTIQKMEKPTMSTKWLVIEKEALVITQFGFLSIREALNFIEEKLLALK